MLNLTSQALAESQNEFQDMYHNDDNINLNLLADDIKSFLHSRQTKLLTALCEDLAGMIEETKYGMETFYGDTSHPHPSVVYGKNEAISDTISEIKKLI